MLVPVRRSVPEGASLCREYLHAARELEHTLALIKGRLYGQAHAIHLAWPELWETAATQLNEHNRIERQMVAELVRQGVGFRRSRDWHGTCSTPRHMAPPGHIHSRRTPVFSVWWPADLGAGRPGSGTAPRVASSPKTSIPPPPTRQPEWLEYLMADPKFDAAAPIVEHRHRHLRKTG